MGMIRHEALVVTAFKRKLAKALRRVAKARAREMYQAHDSCEPPRGIVTRIAGSCTNGYYSFAILPSGSKIGWSTAYAHTLLIECVIIECRALAYEDGSSPVEYVRVAFGADTAYVMESG